MRASVLDANVLLRFLARDVPSQGEAARALLLSAAEGRVELRMTALAFAEVVWVVETIYRWPRAHICEGLMSVLGLPGLGVMESEVLRHALQLYGTLNIDFVDAYQGAWAPAHGCNQVYSFDRHMDRIPGVSRVEPGPV